MSDPMNILAICGDTSPMNPIVPVKLTMDAVINDTMTRQITRSFCASTPRDLAESSPAESKLILLDNSMMAMVPIRVVKNIAGTSSQSMLLSDPTCHL